MKSLSMKPFLFKTPFQLLLTFGFTSGILNIGRKFGNYTTGKLLVL